LISVAHAVVAGVGTDAQRKRFHPGKGKPPKLFKPTVRAVKEIVPNKLIPKLMP
jgi:hypothetical protein